LLSVYTFTCYALSVAPVTYYNCFYRYCDSHSFIHCCELFFCLFLCTLFIYSAFLLPVCFNKFSVQCSGLTGVQRGRGAEPLVGGVRGQRSWKFFGFWTSDISSRICLIRLTVADSVNHNSMDQVIFASTSTGDFMYCELMLFCWRKTHQCRGLDLEV